MIDIVSGAEASTIAYNIAETARANDLKPYEYFKYLLREILKYGEFEDPVFLDALLSWSETLPEACYKAKKRNMPPLPGGIKFYIYLKREYLQTPMPTPPS